MLMLYIFKNVQHWENGQYEVKKSVFSKWVKKKRCRNTGIILNSGDISLELTRVTQSIVFVTAKQVSTQSLTSVSENATMSSPTNYSCSSFKLTSFQHVNMLHTQSS